MRFAEADVDCLCAVKLVLLRGQNLALCEHCASDWIRERALKYRSIVSGFMLMDPGGTRLLVKGILG
jgi:hypothetical protein